MFIACCMLYDVFSLQFLLPVICFICLSYLMTLFTKTLALLISLAPSQNAL